MFPWGMRGERAGELPVEPDPTYVGRLGEYGGRGDVDPAPDHDPTAPLTLIPPILDFWSRRNDGGSLSI